MPLYAMPLLFITPASMCVCVCVSPIALHCFPCGFVESEVPAVPGWSSFLYLLSTRLPQDKAAIKRLVDQERVDVSRIAAGRLGPGFDRGLTKVDRPARVHISPKLLCASCANPSVCTPSLYPL